VGPFQSWVHPERLEETFKKHVGCFCEFKQCVRIPHTPQVNAIVQCTKPKFQVGITDVLRDFGQTAHQRISEEFVMSVQRFTQSNPSEQTLKTTCNTVIYNEAVLITKW